jgi:hypothetical protein
MARFVCPVCWHQAEVEDQHAGKELRCTQCHAAGNVEQAVLVAPRRLPPAEPAEAPARRRPIVGPAPRGGSGEAALAIFTPLLGVVLALALFVAAGNASGSSLVLALAGVIAFFAGLAASAAKQGQISGVGGQPDVSPIWRQPLPT